MVPARSETGDDRPAEASIPWARADNRQREVRLMRPEQPAIAGLAGEAWFRGVHASGAVESIDLRAQSRRLRDGGF